MLLGDVGGLFAAGFPVDPDDSAAVDPHLHTIGRIEDKEIE